MTFFQKFLSRKFLTGLIASLFLVFETKLGLDLDLETKLIVAGLASTWILGETWLDASHAGKDGTPEQRIQRVMAALAQLKPLMPPGMDPLQVFQSLLAGVMGSLQRPAQDSAFRDAVRPSGDGFTVVSETQGASKPE